MKQDATNLDMPVSEHVHKLRYWLMMGGDATDIGRSVAHVLQRDRKIAQKVDRLLKSDNPTIDGPEAHVSHLMSGLAEIQTLIRTQPEIPEGMTEWTGSTGPASDWNGGPVLYANGMLAQPLDDADWTRPAEIPLVAYTARPTLAQMLGRDAIARIIDDEIWDGDGEYPLDRERIRRRRESAYARADQILGAGGQRKVK